MNEDEFLAQVRERASLESTDEARTATRTTFRVLGSRIGDDEASHLERVLPGSFDDDLTWEDGTGAESFDADTFVECVRQRETEAGRVDAADAEEHVKAGASVMNDSVAGGEVDDVRDQLSEGYDRLFDPAGADA